ncbi:MAG: tetratricopeptide repeat protein [Bacteroidota bacterium]
MTRLQKELGLAMADTTRIRLHLELSSANLHRNAQSSLEHLGTARVLAGKTAIDSLYFHVYKGYVNFYFIQQDYERVTVYIDSTFLYKQSVPQEKQLPVLSRLAQSYFFLNEAENALRAYKTALSICQEQGLRTQQIGLLNQISTVYRQQGDFPNAETYILEAIRLNEGRPKGEVMYSKLLLGKLRADQGRDQVAMPIFQEVYAYTQEHREPVLLHSVNSYLGSFYKTQGNYEKALVHIKDNLDINTSINNWIGVMNARSEIADIRTQQGNYEAAILDLTENIALARKSNTPTYIKDSYLMLSEVYERMGEHKKALDERKQYEIWNDSLINQKHLGAVSELQIKYETEKTANELLALSQQRLADEVALQKQQTKIRRLTFGLVAGLLLSGGLFIIFRQHFRNKRQRELLTAIDQTQTKERIRIAQELHDSVGGSLSLAKNKLEHLLDLGEGAQRPLKEFLDSISSTGDQIREISHNMMPTEVVKFGLVPALETLLHNAENESFTTGLYVHGFEERLPIDQELHLYRMTQEALQNTIKHAQAQTFTVHLNRHDSYVSLLLEDNGLGFDFQRTTEHGIGLKGIENRVALLHGKMKIHSAPGKGTTFDIKTPIL